MSFVNLLTLYHDMLIGAHMRGESMLLTSWGALPEKAHRIYLLQYAI